MPAAKELLSTLSVLVPWTRMSLILPRGFVVNDPQLEGNIERINTEPLDLADIARFWKGTSENLPVRMELT